MSGVVFYTSVWEHIVNKQSIHSHLTALDVLVSVLTFFELFEFVCAAYAVKEWD